MLPILVPLAHTLVALNPPIKTTRTTQILTSSTTSPTPCLMKSSVLMRAYGVRLHTVQQGCGITENLRLWVIVCNFTHINPKSVNNLLCISLSVIVSDKTANLRFQGYDIQGHLTFRAMWCSGRVMLKFKNFIGCKCQAFALFLSVTYNSEITDNLNKYSQIYLSLPLGEAWM